MNSVTIHADTSEIDATLNELSELAEFFPEAVKGLVDTPAGISKAICIDLDTGPAPAAGDLRILFKPSDFLLGRVAALRALQRQSSISE